MSEYFRSAEITPKEILAGDSVEIRIKLVTGSDFKGKGSRIIFDLPAFLGYSRSSLQDQEDSGYVEVFCSNPDLVYTKRNWDIEIADFPTREKQSFRGMAQRFFILDFVEGKPSTGDIIEFSWGYPRDGFGCGTKVASIVLRKKFMNMIHVRYFEDASVSLPDFARSYKGYERPVPDIEIPLEYRIVPREPERIRLIRGHRKSLVLLLDRFSNNNPDLPAAKFIEAEGKIRRNADGVLESKDINIQIRSRSLPLFETPGMKNVFEGMNIYFGDLHTHSSFSNDCIEREKQDMTPDDMFRFARNVCNLDFLAVTDHHQPWDEERNRIGEGKWHELQKAVRKHWSEGDFLALPGFEYRCDWRKTIRGDTAVILGEDFSYSEIDDPSLDSISKLWDKFKGRNYMTIPHFHLAGNLPEGEWWECPFEGVEQNLEIYSCHGSFESFTPLERQPPEGKRRRRDRNAEFLLRDKKLKYGLTCNSDGHKGNPGMNGLTAVYSGELTRDAIFAAMRNRSVYGTTNARIRLLFTANGKLMGSTLRNTTEKNFHIDIKGERPFKAVDLMRDCKLHTRFRPASDTFIKDFMVNDDGQYSFWYLRVLQSDHHIAYSSPVWFE